MSDGQKITTGNRWGIWSGVAVVFLCGLLVGIVATTVYQDYQRHQKEERGLAGLKQRVMKHLARELRLSGEQQQAIDPIVTQAERELLRLRMAQQPRLEETLDRTTAAIKTQLSPDQQSKLDELYAKLHRRWDTDRDYTRGLQPEVQDKPASGQTREDPPNP